MANSLRIDGATVVRADIGTSNGGIHVIDEVIMPSDAPAADGDAPAARRRGRDGTSALLALQNGLPAAARSRLENGLREADRTRQEDDRAWVLRHALDDAARAIEGRRMMMTTGR